MFHTHTLRDSLLTWLAVLCLDEMRLYFNSRDRYTAAAYDSPMPMQLNGGSVLEGGRRLRFARPSHSNLFPFAYFAVTETYTEAEYLLCPS